MSRLLILRERVEGERTAALVAELGFQPVCLPVETVIALQPNLKPEDFAGFLVTSRHAVDWLTDNYTGTIKPVLAVGSGTAQKLREAGFVNVEQAEGDGVSLAKLVASRQWGGRLLYAAGHIRRPDFEQRLASENIGFVTAEVYDVQTSLPDKRHIEDALGTPVAGVLLLSAAQAHTFGELVKRHRKLLEPLPMVFCLSGRIAAELPNEISANVAISDRPDLESLLALLQSYRCRMQ
ncbi:uroporphyrinogen-III synthase [Aureimonas fodinaquatilis]|uniref:uroporphyrinogen-III synthase n=1 Tax=Aureimonas fodinaquatilis TaxID=2565783 RepID=UPI00165D76BA|nr:uroporphyrinogen-III synthase [Aureimonas fodinaquatilis]